MIEASKFVSSDLDVPRDARLSNTCSHSATVRGPSKVATRSLDFYLYCMQFSFFHDMASVQIKVMKVFSELFRGRQRRFLHSRAALQNWAPLHGLVLLPCLPTSGSLRWAAINKDLKIIYLFSWITGVQ